MTVVGNVKMAEKDKVRFLVKKGTAGKEKEKVSPARFRCHTPNR